MEEMKRGEHWILYSFVFLLVIGFFVFLFPQTVDASGGKRTVQTVYRWLSRSVPQTRNWLDGFVAVFAGSMLPVVDGAAEPGAGQARSS